MTGRAEKQNPEGIQASAKAVAARGGGAAELGALEPASQEDLAIISAQIGRKARGRVQVAHRCRYGLPDVTRTYPYLDEGTPFPTLFWLTCPLAVREIGRLESSGLMRMMEQKLRADESLAREYRLAHRAYVEERDSLAPLPGSPAVGGMPERVKCLHALYAHWLARGGNPVGRMVAEHIEPLPCPGPCVVDGKPVPGHPGFRSRRRRGRAARGGSTS